MKEYDDTTSKDMVREWVTATPDVKAPQGFTHNLMTRINLEHIPSPSVTRGIISLQFKIWSSVAFVALLILSLTTPSISESIPGMADLLSRISMPEYKFSLPQISLDGQYTYIMYIITGVSVFVLSDLIISRFISTRREKGH